MGARLGAKNMQVSSVNSIKFTGISPQDIENRARVLQDDEQFQEEFDAKLNPELYADVLDSKLKKSKMGRKIVNYAAAAAAFALGVLSFRKVLPKLRLAVASNITKCTNKLGKEAVERGKDKVGEMAELAGKQAEGLGGAGNKEKFQNLLVRIFGDKRGETVGKGLKKFGIESGMDVVDTAAATTIATLAGNEARDISDEKQKDATVGSVLRDLTKISNVVGGDININGIIQ